MLHLLRRSRSPAATTASRANWLSELHSQASSASEKDVVLDMSGIERIDSRQLGELVKIHLGLRQSNRRLVVDNAQGAVLEVLGLTRIDRLIEVRESPLGN